MVYKDSMIRSYRDRDTERLAAGEKVRQWEPFRRQAEKRLRILEAAISLGDLAAPNSNRLETRRSYRSSAKPPLSTPGRQAERDGGHGLAPQPVFRHVGRFLDEPPERVRARPGSSGARQGNSAHPEAQRDGGASARGLRRAR